MLAHRVFVDPQMLEAAILRSRIDHGAERVHQFAARAVVQRQREHHAGIVRGALARPGHALLHIVGQFLLPANIFQADIVFVQRGDFRLEIAAQQAASGNRLRSVGRFFQFSSEKA